MIVSLSRIVAWAIAFSFVACPAVVYAADRTWVYLPLAPDANVHSVSKSQWTPVDASQPSQRTPDDSPAAWSKYTEIWKSHHVDPSQPDIRRWLTLPTNQSSDIQNSPGRASPAFLKWRRGTFQVWQTRHFEIFTRIDAESMRHVANDLEHIYWAWTQLFFPLWLQSEQVATALQGWQPDHQSAAEFLSLAPRPAGLTPRMRHRVVLLSDADEYRATLARREIAAGNESLIAASTGFYSDTLRVVFLYPDGDASSRRHEVCHQLFSEATSARGVSPLKVRGSEDFWLVEGIAGYFESMSSDGVMATFGGWDAARLQFARYRTLIENQTPASVDQIRGSATSVFRREDLPSWYHQSILQTHARMDGTDFRYRHHLIERLHAIYERRSSDPFFNRTNDPITEPAPNDLVKFLSVDDVHLQNNQWVQSPASICLAGCPITDAGLEAIGKLGAIEWLDLSRLPVDDKRIIQLLDDTRKLKQLSLEATAITAAGIQAVLQQASQLRELDLSWTKVNDSAVSTIVGCQKLETLWLTGTSITDQSIDAIAQLPALTTIDIQRTDVSPSGLAKLQSLRPNLSLNPLQLQ